MKKEHITIRDKREITPDNSIAIPYDFNLKYIKLFKKEEQVRAVFDLISQAYRAGLEIGRDEKNGNTKHNTNAK